MSIRYPEVEMIIKILFWYKCKFIHKWTWHGCMPTRCLQQLFNKLHTMASTIKKSVIIIIVKCYLGCFKVLDVYTTSGIFRGCRWQPLYWFHFDFWYVTFVRYIDIYIICVPTRNRNNEFILEFILREIKMADFER